MEDYQLKLKSKQYLDRHSFKKVIKYIHKNDPSIELMDIVLQYLENYPQQTSLVPIKLFIHLLLSTEKTLHPLVLFLASRHDDINYDILNLENLPAEKWAYLMSAFYQRLPQMIHDPILVKNVKNTMNIYKTLINCPQWFIENIEFFLGLHLIEFDENECHKLFKKLKANWPIFTVSQATVSFVDLVANKCNKEIKYLQFLISALFSLPPESNDVIWLSNQIINNLKLLENNFSIKIRDWDAIIMKSVVSGLMETNPNYGFIKVLRKLIKKADIDKSVISKSFELLVGHSQFSNIMLNRSVQQPQKEEVLRFIETLVKKEPSLMALSHIPLYLCSYNASLSVTDQLLLRILFHYEENSIPLSNYRPYLWGSFAVSHYQVKNHLISKTLNSFPSTTEVLSYIPLKRLKETISYFPVDRVLHVKNQKIIRYDTRKDPNKMFDPAFFLPMISSLLATEAPLSIEKFNRSGCLSMVLICLGSCDNPMRSAAYHVLTLLRSHLFCRRAENMFWDYFITWVARGIQDLHLKPPPQLSIIQALFLSRMVLGIANHEKGIEEACCKILLNRPAARLNHIPELKTILMSFSEISPRDNSVHMRWFFEIIRDGLRSKTDWSVLKNMDLLNICIVVFKFSNEKEKVLILEIMENIFRIEPATNGGSGGWALGMMTVISKSPKRLSANEICVLFRCLQSLSNSSYIGIPATDFLLFLFLEYGCNDNVCHEAFVTLNNVVAKYKDVYQVLTEDNLTQILNCGETSKVLSDDEILKCRSILKYGINGVQIDKSSTYLFLPTMVNILKEKKK